LNEQYTAPAAEEKELPQEVLSTTAPADTGAHPPVPVSDEAVGDETAENGKAKLVTNQALGADEYVLSEPYIESDLLTDEEEEELSGIHIDYDMQAEEIVPALKAFQKKVAFKRNLIYSLILAVLGVLYFYQVWQKPDYDMGKVLGALCFFVILMIWYLPRRHIQSTVKAIENEKMNFSIEVSEVGFLILEGEGKYLVRYSTPSVAVIELPNVYTICVTKEKVFIIPKRCVPAEVKDEVERRMKEGLGDRYTVKEK